MAEGWAKFYRKIREHAVWDHDGIFKLFFHCVMEANWKTSSYKIPGCNELIEIERGQFVTGQNVLYAGLYRRASKDAPNSRTVWKWLHVLQDFDCVKLHALGTKCTVVTVNNYESYQDVQDVEGIDRAEQGHNEGIMRATSEEGKKERTERKNVNTRAAFVPPTLEMVSAYCQERNNVVDPKAWMDHYIANGWMVGKNKMRDWQAAVRTWENLQSPQKTTKPAKQRLLTPEEELTWSPYKNYD